MGIEQTRNYKHIPDTAHLKAAKDEEKRLPKGRST